eukprot:m51a1_g13556 hypothetical protein (293) ;mRNA; f:231-1213
MLVEQVVCSPTRGRCRASAGKPCTTHSETSPVGFPVLVAAQRGEEGALERAVWQRLRWFLRKELREGPEVAYESLATSPFELVVRPATAFVPETAQVVWDWFSYRQMFDLQWATRIGVADEPASAQSTAAKPLSLEDCLGMFTQPEHLTDASWNCPKCRAPRSAVKRISFWRLPPVLVLHLQRFDRESHPLFARKAQDLVTFPMTLDLSAYCAHSGGGCGAPGEPQSSVYDLFAVCNHHGAASFGHYTAFVKTSDGWVLCDDESLRNVSESDVVSPAAYVLLYQLRDFEPRK